MDNTVALKDYFVEFEKVQDRQITVLENQKHINSNGNINSNRNSNKDIDLDSMIFERNRAFENLRNALSLVPASVLNNFKQYADAIINRDRFFMANLENYKNELSKKINQSVKGKHLLKGYSTGTTKSLRFMNNKI
ncbi:MAG: hypothetical protein AB7U45_08580 [Desulfamplus sp.]